MKLGEINEKGENNRRLKLRIIDKWRDLNIKRNKEKEEKNQEKDMWHVGKREEASSFLKYA